MAVATNASKVHVVIRVRPLSVHAGSDDATVRWKVNGNQIFEAGQDDGFTRPASKPYVFDRIFESQSTTEQVFDEVALPILSGVMDGYNGTIIAYGQTSSGKTHTMMGSKFNEGVIPRMARSLFECIEKTPTRDFLLRVTCLEIYNEKIYDLLSISTPRKALNVREDMNGKPFVEDLTWAFVKNFHHLMETMWQCEGNRSFGATAMNDRSSRSHTIFSMIIESSLPQDGSENSDEGAVRVSHLNLVDLAGSERAYQMGPSKNSFKEGCAINTSLFALRNVFVKFKQSDNSSQFINFRDSKLTRILQPSLGGNAKLSIICTVTPDQIEETHSTLKFASTAKTCENKPRVNEIVSEEALLKRYARQLKDLLNEREEVKKREKNQEQIERELEDSNKKNFELEAKIRNLNERIIHSSKAATVNFSHKNRRETWAGGLKMGFDDPFSCPGELPPFSELAKWQDKVYSEDDLSISSSSIFRRAEHINSAPSEFVREQCSVECQTDESVSCDDAATLKSEIETLTAQNLKLRFENGTLKGRIKLSEDSIISLSSEAKDMQEFHRLQDLDHVELENKLKDAREKIRSIEKTTRDAESLYLESNRKCSMLADDCLRMQAQIAQLESANKNASDQEAKMTLSISASQNYKKELMLAQKRISLLENNQKDHEVFLDLQNERHEILVRELRGQLQDAYEHIKSLEEAKKANDHKTEEMDSSEAEVAGLKNEQALISANRIKQLEMELEDSKRCATEMTNIVSELRSRCAELELSIERLNSRNEKDVEQLSKLEEIACEFSEISEVQKDYASVLGELQLVKTRNEELLKDSEDLTNKLREHFDEMAALKSQVAKVSAENSQLKAECLELAAKVSEIGTVPESSHVSDVENDDIQCLKDQIFKLESLNATLGEQTKDLELKNFELLAEINDLKLKLDEILRKNAEIEAMSAAESKSDLKTCLPVEESPINSEEQVEEEAILEIEKVNLVQQKSNLELENAELKEELRTVRLQFEDHLNKAPVAELQVETGSAELNNDISRVTFMKTLTATFNTSEPVISLMQQLDSIWRKLQEQKQLFKELDADYAKSVADNQALKAIVSELMDELRERQATILNEIHLRETGLKKVRENFESKMAFTEMRCAEYEDMVRFLEEDRCRETAEFQRKVDELESRVKVLNNTINDLKEKIAQGCTHEAEMMIVQQDYERRKDAFNKELRRLRKESEFNAKRNLDVADQERDCSRCLQLLQRNASVNEDAAIIEKKLLALKVEHSELQERYEDVLEARDKYESDCDDYHKECEEKEAELTSLRKQLEILPPKATELSNPQIICQLEKLQADNNRLRNELNSRIKGGLQESGRIEAEKRKLQVKVQSLEGLVAVLEKKNVNLKGDVRRLQQLLDTNCAQDIRDIPTPSGVHRNQLLLEQQSTLFSTEDSKGCSVSIKSGCFMTSDGSQRSGATLDRPNNELDLKVNELKSRNWSPKKRLKPIELAASCDSPNSPRLTLKENSMVNEEFRSSPKKVKYLGVNQGSENLLPKTTQKGIKDGEEFRTAKDDCKVN